MRRTSILVLSLLSAVGLASGCVVPPGPPATQTSSWTVANMPLTNIVPATMLGSAWVYGPASMIGQHVRVQWSCGGTTLQDTDLVLAEVGGVGRASVGLPPEIVNGGYGFCTFSDTTDVGMPLPWAVAWYADWYNPGRWAVAVTHGPDLPATASVTTRTTVFNVKDMAVGSPTSGTLSGFSWTAAPAGNSGEKARLVYSCPSTGYWLDSVATIATPYPATGGVIGASPYPAIGGATDCTLTEVTTTAVPPAVRARLLPAGGGAPSPAILVEH